MMYGVCNLSMIPMRTEPAESSELTSQLLFGEAYCILEELEKWLKIATVDCQYEGWIDRKLFNPLADNDVEHYLSCKKYVVKDWSLLIKEKDNDITFPIFIGSSFPYPIEGKLTLGKNTFQVELPDEKNIKINPSLSVQEDALLRFATTYLHSPYLWGGRTPAGIDCSGFVQVVFKSLGIGLPRNASQQAQCGELVDFVDEAHIGDVAFFENTGGRIIHTGIICGPGQIIHASGRVRIDPIDQTGIFNNEIGKYSHSLRLIKRFLSC